MTAADMPLPVAEVVRQHYGGRPRNIGFNAARLIVDESTVAPGDKLYPLSALEEYAAARVAEVAGQMAEALRKADQFITNGIALGFIRMPDPDTPDTAHQTPGIVRAAIAAYKEATK